MQIIELYVRGYKRILGRQSSLSGNNLVDSNASFTTDVRQGDQIFNVTLATSTFITQVVSDTELDIQSNIFFSNRNDDYLIIADYQRLDLFKDESVTITDTLMNLRDISKVYTPFSQQFTLPASKQNQKVFRHYENQQVTNGFDARFRQDAIIKLNGISYSKGKIQFKSVQLKDNKAHSYKVVFFGDAVELKDLLANTMLENLDYGNLNFDYNSTQIINKLTTQSFQSIIVPNIAHSKNMRLVSSGYKDNTTDTNLIWTDLKPAIQCFRIIEAIERTFPEIQFSGFFSSYVFKRLYMWMHRNQGYVTNAEEGGDNYIITNFLHLQDDDPGYVFQSAQSTSINQDPRPMTLPWGSSNQEWSVQFVVKVIVTTSTTESYTVTIRHKTQPVEYVSQQYSQTTTTTTEFIFDSYSAYSTGLTLELAIDIEANNVISMQQRVEVTRRYYPTPWSSNPVTSWIAVFTDASSEVLNEFNIARQMPKMKVIDFLSGLFKMFNLVVRVEDGIMRIFRASSYLEQGKSYDITRYVGMEESSIERITPFNQMEFKFKSKKSFLVQFSDEIQGIPFSQENYPSGIQNVPFDGTPYNVDLPFEKMMYERLSDHNGNLTTLTQGAMLDKKFEATIGEPLLFWPIVQQNTGNHFKIEDDTSTLQTPTRYFRPSNLSSLNYFGDKKLQLNFGLERDEFTLGTSDTFTNLYESAYRDYVESMFNPTGRMLKVTAYLPQGLLTSYGLNDKFVISNTVYRINSIKTNLLNNKTTLQLYNKDEFISQIENNESANFERVAQVTATKTQTTITVTYTKFATAPTDFEQYDITLNGEVEESRKQTDTNTYTITGLEADSFFELGVQAVYTVGSETGRSLNTIINITTDE